MHKSREASVGQAAAAPDKEEEVVLLFDAQDPEDPSERIKRSVLSAAADDSRWAVAALRGERKKHAGAFCHYNCFVKCITPTPSRPRSPGWQGSSGATRPGLDRTAIGLASVPLLDPEIIRSGVRAR